MVDIHGAGLGLLVWRYEVGLQKRGSFMTDSSGDERGLQAGVGKVIPTVDHDRDRQGVL